ncbi:DUF5343 domain-containing protein [Sphingomonas sp. Tas61C01]|uniref:DUF5343 domain-containing protein n=1 Tax=Sphingomonas sp. Tas61C01 TaxID=3458297 RepID=UPI00403EE727
MALGTFFDGGSVALTSSYVLGVSRFPDFFARIRDGQAPDQFTNQLLKDWGFSSSNDRAFIPLLKSLGFLSASGQPTQRYHDYRDHSQSRKVLAESLREAYRDIFLITSSPKEGDRESVKGKFKSYHNASDNTAANMTATFYGLLKLADLSSAADARSDVKKGHEREEASPVIEAQSSEGANGSNKIGTSFHYNIQVHLPATKDVEVYNAIFKSLKEHLVE